MDQQEDHKHSWQDDLSELIQKKKEESQILKKLELSLLQTGRSQALKDDSEEASTDEADTQDNVNQEHINQE